MSWNGVCVEDSSDRLLPDEISPKIPDQTPAKCIRACQDLGFSFAGVQDGIQCNCGDVAPPLDKIISMNECTLPDCTNCRNCAGDPSKPCGGPYKMIVFTV